MNQKNYNEIFGKNLKKYRMQKFMSIMELSKAIGISYESLAGYEAGRSLPKAPKIRKLQEYYGLESPWCFFNEDNSPTPINDVVITG